MIWSKESLQDLAESNLCLKVLIPLFRAMGYQGVRYYHGGVLEQGKDIVMWKYDELRGRVNYAVVVKAEKITGAASTLSIVAFQAQQALGSTFHDEQTQETHSVHEVFVVTSHEITKEGDESLQSAWGGVQVQKRVTKIGGERLWELVQKYLPNETVFASLAEAAKALNEADPDYGYIAEVAPGRIHVTAFPKRDQTEPIPVSFEPSFPDTPEGREQELAFQSFLSSGRPAQVKADYLTIKGLPDPMRRMLQGSTEGTFLFGPRKFPKVFVMTLTIRGIDGEEVSLFPLIEFGANFAGEEEITLSNEQQSIPFKFWLTISRSKKETDFKFDFSSAESNAFSLLRATEFELALARGGKLIFQEYDTGSMLAVFSVSPGTFTPPENGFLEMLRKLNWIERQLGVVIPLPDREIFSSDDVEEILFIENVIRSGRMLGKIDDVKVTFRPGALEKILTKHSDGVLGEMRFLQDYRRQLLGTEVLLGPVELNSKRVQIDPSQLDQLGKPNNPQGSDDIPVIRLIPVEGEFETKFKDWPKVSEGEETRL